MEKSLEWAQAYLHTDATIYSDSLSSIKAIENASNTNPIVTSIQEHLNTLMRRHFIKLVWVRAHIGVTGNEEADAAAKSASKQHTQYAYNNFPLSLAKRIIRERIWNEWASEYENAIQGSVTRGWFPSLESVKSFTKNSEISFEMTQILTGHGFNKYNLHRFKITENDSCPCDGATS